MSERETVDFLGTVPLLEGQEERDLVELARVMRRRTVREGEILWRQGDHAQEMLFIVDGAVSASLRVPGDRTVEIGRAGPGDVVGEMGLLAWTTPDALLGASGFLKIASEPAASLVVDGVGFGQTPLRLRRPLGDHLVELSRVGFHTLRSWITVGADTEELHAALKIDPPKIESREAV